jgi:hypothetical protein
MTIEAPLSRYKKQNLLLFTAVLIGLGIWFYYDGHYNEKLLEKHTVDGKPDSTLLFNQKSPPFLILGGVRLPFIFLPYAIRRWLPMIRGSRPAARRSTMRRLRKSTRRILTAAGILW